MRKLFWALALSLALGACTVAPTSPTEGVVACYYTVRTAFATAADMKARNALSAEQEKQVVAAGDQALVACDAARAAFNAGDIASAESNLQLANALLLQLESFLKIQEGK